MRREVQRCKRRTCITRLLSLEVILGACVALASVAFVAFAAFAAAMFIAQMTHSKAMARDIFSVSAAVSRH